MLCDLRTILDGWDYEPGKISVRKIIGREGCEKIQTRIDMGVLQIELEGRPDGQRCRGYDSLLEFFEAQVQQHIELYGNDEEFALSAEDCLELRHEAYLYYQRYLSLFVLEDYERVARDTARNLRVIRFCARYGGADDDRAALESQHAYVLMMNIRARACGALQECRHEDALAEVAAGMQELHALEADADDPPDISGELRVLSELRADILKQMPDDAPPRLRWELEAALAREDYEAAARIRDRLATAS